MTKSYAELRRLAGKAADGEWFCDPKPTNAGLALVDNGTSSMHPIRAEWHEAAYIVAAQPRNILALLDRIEALEGALRPFAAAVFNDNGDVTYDFTAFKSEDLFRAYRLLRARAALEGERT